MNIIFVARPDRGAGNDPETLRLAFHQGPTVIDRTIALCASPGSLLKPRGES